MPNAEVLSVARTDDRRTKPRICVPFHATVCWVNSDGKEFNAETVLDNMSGDGLYMRMMPSVTEGTRLSIVVRLDTASNLTHEASRLCVDGMVLRTENKAGGVCGVAVAFDHVRYA